MVTGSIVLKCVARAYRVTSGPPHSLHLHPSFSDLPTLQRDQVGAKECWKGAPKGRRGTAAGRAGEVAFPSHPDIEVGGDMRTGGEGVSR